jgi:uncharacterized protein (DUF305 family)
MKSIIALAIVLIIGYFIGSFTNKNESFTNIFNKDKNKISQLDLLNNTKDLISQITSSAQKETGEIFDKQYLDAMITMYEGSVTLSKIGTVASGRPELRNTAKTVSKDDAITLAQLKKWRSEWYPEETKTPPATIKPSFVK